MGKAGKARKKLRLDGGIALSNDDQYSSGEELPTENDSMERNIQLLVEVVKLLSARSDLLKDKRMKEFRRQLFPLVESQKGKYFDPILSSENRELLSNDGSLRPEILLATLKTIAFLAKNAELLNSSSCKLLRRALHGMLPIFFPATISTSVPEKVSSTVKISYSFRLRRYEEVVSQILEMLNSDNEIPKLGSLQRWVRECDVTTAAQPDCGKDSKHLEQLSQLLLYYVLLVVSKKLNRACAKTEGTAAYAAVNTVQIVRHDVFRAKTVLENNNTRCLDVETAAQIEQEHLFEVHNSSKPLPPATSAYFHQRKTIVSHIKGADRRPPSEHDLNIYSSSPHTIYFHDDAASSLPQQQTQEQGTFQQAMRRYLSCYATPTPQKLDVPRVPGAFLIHNALSAAECSQLITCAETIGYVPDAVEGIDNIIIFAEDSLYGAILKRVWPHLPPTLQGCKLKGVNRRFRLFRYYPGAVYRPHIDGSWTGSGLNEKGELLDDCYGDRTSKLTFLVYLNEEFSGGATTFFLADAKNNHTVDGVSVGTIDAYGVEPCRGSVLCFPHGDSEYSLVHEGSAVLQGVKYVIRSDVLYANEPDT